MFMKKKIKINLGCGSHIIEGDEWVNVDNYLLFNGEPRKHFVQADIIKPLPFETNSVDYIICDQVLEHIPMKDIPGVLYEIRRVLKEKGTATIIVPDFKGAVEQWLKIDHNQNFDPTVYTWLSEVVYGNQTHQGEFHKTAMSAGYLNYVLNMVGLVNHKLILYPAFGTIPNYEGVRPYEKNAVCRNAQLVAEIIK